MMRYGKWIGSTASRWCWYQTWQTARMYRRIADQFSARVEITTCRWDSDGRPCVHMIVKLAQAAPLITIDAVILGG